MKNLNLFEILKNVPRGTKLYSPIFGECELEKINVDTGTICVIKGACPKFFYEDGTFDRSGDECLLFPSRENRDWSTFKVEKEGFEVGNHIKVALSDRVYLIKQIRETSVLVSTIVTFSNYYEFSINKSDISEKVSKFDPKWLKPFDRVLVRDDADSTWRATLFSHNSKRDRVFPYATCESSYVYCIPYNEETEHLVGTADGEPEFYKIDHNEKDNVLR